MMEGATGRGRWISSLTGAAASSCSRRSGAGWSPGGEHRRTGGIGLRDSVPQLPNDLLQRAGACRQLPPFGVVEDDRQHLADALAADDGWQAEADVGDVTEAVSYTHLTLPTNREV